MTDCSRGCSRSRRRGSWNGAVASYTFWIWCMRLVRAELFELALPLVEPFIISGGAITERRALVVALHDADGHHGYGESPPFELPFYSEETLAGVTDLVRRVLLPRVVGREFATPEALDAVLRDGIRGNPFARAGVETAAWCPARRCGTLWRRSGHSAGSHARHPHAARV